MIAAVHACNTLLQTEQVRPESAMIGAFVMSGGAMDRTRLSVCTLPGCPTLCTGGRCAEHKRAADRQRGSAAERGYSGKAWTLARRVVLRRDPICVVCKRAFSTVADHWPTSRRDLLAQGVTDPDAPHRLRGLCHSCHSKETAREQPGGFNRRD